MERTRLEDSVYLIPKTRFSGYRVVYSFLKDDYNIKDFKVSDLGSWKRLFKGINWFNVLTGGSWANLLKLSAIVGVVIAVTLCYRMDIINTLEWCKQVNPCDWSIVK